MATAGRRTTTARSSDRNCSKKGRLENNSSNSRNERTYADAREASWVYVVGFRARSSGKTRATAPVVLQVGGPTLVARYNERHRFWLGRQGRFRRLSALVPPLPQARWIAFWIARVITIEGA